MLELLFKTPTPSYETSRPAGSPIDGLSSFLSGLLEQPKPTYKVDPRLTAPGLFCGTQPRYDFEPPRPQSESGRKRRSDNK